jgi:deoxyribonuclease-4
MDKLRFGTAGIPFSTKERNTVNGVKRVRELNLDSMELEFVRSVNITKEKAPEVAQAKKDNDVVLTIHGPYFINLNAKEKPKLYASINRILSSARIGNLCGVWSTCFHSAFYLGMEKEAVYNNVKESMKKIMSTLKDEGIKMWIRPETAGKVVQFGNLKELVRLSKEIEGVLPCVDVAHLHAQSNGKVNTTAEFKETLEFIEKELGREALNNMHIHIAGIEYSEKGERKHLNLNDSDFNYKDLLKVWKDFKIKGAVICETPNIEDDALMLQKLYNQI